MEKRKPSPKIKAAKTNAFKLPSQRELLKNPMKYIEIAMDEFRRLNARVEEQGKAIVQIAQHIEDSDQKLAPLITAIEKAQAARQQGQATTTGQTNPIAGQGLGALIPLLIQGLAGGGSNPMQERMFNAMFEKTMMGMDLSNALTKAMIIKLAPELADTLAKTIVKKA